MQGQVSYAYKLHKKHWQACTEPTMHVYSLIVYVL